MALEIRTAATQAAVRRGATAGLFEVPQHLWRTDDGRLVETGHLDARRLAYTGGQQIPVETAVAEGLLPAEALPADEVPPYPPDAAPPGRAEPAKTPPAKKAAAKRKEGPPDA